MGPDLQQRQQSLLWSRLLPETQNVVIVENISSSNTYLHVWLMDRDWGQGCHWSWNVASLGDSTSNLWRLMLGCNIWLVQCSSQMKKAGLGVTWSWRGNSGDPESRVVSLSTLNKCFSCCYRWQHGSILNIDFLCHIGLMIVIMLMYSFLSWIAISIIPCHLPRIN